jgi:hypothetical protein
MEFLISLLAIIRLFEKIKKSLSSLVRILRGLKRFDDYPAGCENIECVERNKISELA